MKILPIQTGSSGNMYLVETEQKNNFILEAGLDKNTTLKTLFHLGKLVSDFKGCFISHKHSDHSRLGVYFNKYMPIYANREVMQTLKYRGQNLDFNTSYEFSDLKVLPFEVKHGNVLNNAFIFKDEKSTILFITDFFTFEANISKIQFTEIFIECNWTKELLEQALANDEDAKSKYERQFNTHASLDLCESVLKSLDLSKCEKITLIHPSKYLCDKELAVEILKKDFPNIEIEFAKNRIGGKNGN